MCPVRNFAPKIPRKQNKTEIKLFLHTMTQIRAMKYQKSLQKGKECTENINSQSVITATRMLCLNS